MPVNPILRRELKTSLRSPVALALAAVYLGVLAALVWWMWPQEGIFSLAAQASRSILLVLAVTQLLLVILYAPAFAATAITSEKEQNTYDLLFTTMLRPRQIIVGKLVSSILCLVLFVMFSFPIFTACFFLGAVSLKETAVIYLVMVVSSVFFGLLALTISALVASSHTALVSTYLVLLLISAGPWVPFLLLEHQHWATVFIYNVRALSPLVAMASVIVPSFETMPGWRLYVAFAGCGSVALTLFLLASVYLTGSRPARAHGRTIEDPQELMKRKLRFPFYLIDPMRRKKHIPDWINPVFAKEMRSKAFGGGIWIFRSAYACFAVSVLLMALVAGNLVGQTPDVIRAVAVGFQLGLIVLVVPSLTAGAVTQERERGNLDLLRLSRISPWQFLLGKLGVAWVFIAFLLIGSLPAWYVIGYLKTNTPQEILACWLILGTTILLATMTGLFGSAVARRTSAATAIAYGMLFLIVLGTLVPALAHDQLTARVRDLLFAFNPFVSAIQVLTNGFFEDIPELWRSHLVVTLGLSAAFFLCAYLRVRRMLLPDP